MAGVKLAAVNAGEAVVESLLSGLVKILAVFLERAELILSVENILSLFSSELAVVELVALYYLNAGDVLKNENGAGVEDGDEWCRRYRRRQEKRFCQGLCRSQFSRSCTRL